jgi:hypothetical protein
MDRGTGSAAVSWIALIISIVALVLAWTAFNRAGDDVGDTLQEQFQIETNQERPDSDDVQMPNDFDFDAETENDDTNEAQPNQNEAQQQ